MLESPDYFFRVREIGRLRQTNVSSYIQLSNNLRDINIPAL